MAMRLGLIGHGAIAQHVIAALESGALPDVEIPAVLVRQARQTAAGKRVITNDPAAFLAHRFDAVLECAGHQAVREHGERVLEAGADLIVTSVGAFTDETLLARMRDAAEKAQRRLVLPSAGIGALDILSAVATGGLDEVTVTVRKDPLSWQGTIAAQSHDLARLAGAVVLYDGPVREGARLYPQNVNIAAAAALAGIGLDRTRLIIVADPAIATHQVEIAASGAFGSFRFAEDVVPSAENPKTGRLVAMALIKTVRQLRATLVIGA
jgi:aspartate dehydrogenase